MLTHSYKKTEYTLLVSICIILNTFYPPKCNAEQSVRERYAAIDCQNISLVNCTKRIEEQTHVRILTPAELSQKIMKVSSPGATLENIFELLAKDLSLENYSVIFDDEMKSIYLTLLGSKNDLLNGTMGMVPFPVARPQDYVDGNTNIISSSDDNIFNPSKDEEILPPNVPGGQGITRKEMHEQESGQPGLGDLLDLEALPPSKPGEKGVTLRQLKVQEEQAKLDSFDILAMEALPPDKPGEKGLTLNEIKEQEAHMDPLVLPESHSTKDSLTNVEGSNKPN